MFTRPHSRVEYMVHIQPTLLGIGTASGPANPLEAARAISSSPAAQALIVVGLGSGSESEAFSFYIDFLEALFTTPAEELCSLELFLVQLINSRVVTPVA